MNPEELKLIERIKKLQAMADSARAVGSLAEAESFMDAVAKTLAKHNLDASVLSLDTRNLRDPLGSSFALGSKERGKGKPTQWAWILSDAVARAHHCENLVALGGSGVWFYGRQSNHETAKKMFVYLRDMAEREGMKAWRKRRREYVKEFGGHGHGDSISWFFAYCEAFAREVGRRYDTMRARVESDSGMALVLTSVRKEAEEFAKDKITPKEERKEEKPVLSGGWHEDAREQGEEAASSAALGADALDGASARASKMIGG